jgi:uncharacterized caspase-like protein
MAIGPRTFPDHFVSIYQSAAAELARRMESKAPSDAKGLATSAILTVAAEAAERRMQDRGGALLASQATSPPLGEAMSGLGGLRACAEFALQYLEAQLKGDSGTAQSIKEQLRDATCDPGWITTIEEYLSYFGPNGERRSPPYRRAASLGDNVIPINSDARIALVGDWGTGAGPAASVMQQIAGFKPDLIVHLGDIYYSGTPDECTTNFLEPLDNAFSGRGRPPVFALPGNHDMYSGGQGYYDLIDKLNSADLRQRGSFFCLRSVDNAWQLLGLDTGLNDYSPFSVVDVITHLESDEEDWHLDRIREFSGRTILLSHHQLFSAFLHIGKRDATGRFCAHNPRLLETYRRFTSTGKQIAAWFWGHEHNLCIFEGHLGLPRGRCIGHGGIPVFVEGKPYEPLTDLDHSPRLVKGASLAADGEVYANGFALLTLQPASRDAEVVYYQDKGGKAVGICRERLTGGVAVELLGESGEEFARKANPEFFAPVMASGRQRKFAFVVGNGAYSSVSRLANSAADAVALKGELERLGFAIYGGTNFDLQTLEQRFTEFVSKLGGAEVVLFYFSGHGVQMEGKNYLIPVDGDLDALQSPARRFQLQECVNRILGKGKARRCLLFLDACRDNPFVPMTPVLAGDGKDVAVGANEPKSIAPLSNRPLASFVARGLAPLDVAPDAQAFIAFAAAPGRFAYASKGKLSFFTEALIRHLDTQGLGLDGLMKRVGSDVKAATESAQDPWIQSNLKEDFFFKPLSTAPVYLMATLGALSGFLTALFVYSPEGQFQNQYLAGTLLSAVVGYGVWRWGRHSFFGAMLAFVVGSVSWALGMAILDYFGTFSDRAELTPLSFKNWKLTRDAICWQFAAPIAIGGCVLGGGLTTPSLRRASFYAMSLLSAALVVLVYGMVRLATFMVTIKSDAMRDVISNYGTSILWQALVAGAIGYGLANYVPEPEERRPPQST